MSFSHQHQLVVFYRSLRYSKSSQVSRTLLSILADLNNVVVWMVSILPLISTSSSLFYKACGDHSKHTNYNCYHDHPHVPEFFVVLWQDPSTYLSFCFLLFSLCGLPDQQNPPDDKFFFLVNQHKVLLLLLLSFYSFKSFPL